MIESYKQFRLENLVTLNILDFVNINFDIARFGCRTNLFSVASQDLL